MGDCGCFPLAGASEVAHSGFACVTQNHLPTWDTLLPLPPGGILRKVMEATGLDWHVCQQGKIHMTPSFLLSGTGFPVQRRLQLVARQVPVLTLELGEEAARSTQHSPALPCWRPH